MDKFVFNVIGVLGGMFDLIYIGYLCLVWEVKFCLGLDFVWFIFCYMFIYWESLDSIVKYCLMMVELVCIGVLGFEVDNWEIICNEFFYSIIILIYICDQIGVNVLLVFIMGMDVFN